MPRSPLITTADPPDNSAILICGSSMHRAPGAEARNSGQVAISGHADYLAGHIPGAAFLDLMCDLSDTSSPHRFSVLAPAAFAAAAGRLGIGAGTRVVLYDGGYNAWAARAGWMLKGHGLDDTQVLDGGLIKWRHEGRPLTTEATTHPSASFTARPRSGYSPTKSA